MKILRGIRDFIKRSLDTLCQCTGHDWKYYFTALDAPNRQFRCCRICGDMQEYRTLNLPFTKSCGWYSLVSRTQHGAEVFLGELIDRKILVACGVTEWQLEHYSWFVEDIGANKYHCIGYHPVSKRIDIIRENVTI